MTARPPRGKIALVGLTRIAVSAVIALTGWLLSLVWTISFAGWAPRGRPHFCGDRGAGGTAPIALGRSSISPWWDRVLLPRAPFGP